MKILAFAATNSKNSINKKLVTYSTSLIKNPSKEIEVIDLNDYEMDIYSVDREAEYGIPEKAKKLYKKIGSVDLVIISLAEFNGSYTSAYKNVFDWLSRISQKVFQGRDVIYLSTSPGEYGATSVLGQAKESIKYFDGNLVGFYSLPLFYENFDEIKLRIKHDVLNEKLSEIVNYK